MFLSLPFTCLTIAPINKRLLSWPPDGDMEIVQKLLEQWGRRHMVRDVLSLVGSLLFVFIVMHGNNHIMQR